MNQKGQEKKFNKNIKTRRETCCKLTIKQSYFKHISNLNLWLLLFVTLSELVVPTQVLKTICKLARKRSWEPFHYIFYITKKDFLY